MTEVGPTLLRVLLAKEIVSMFFTGQIYEKLMGFRSLGFVRDWDQQQRNVISIYRSKPHLFKGRLNHTI
jgi:hypothetical protein